MNAPLVFLDTETTGLAPCDEIWEFAAIRREPDGAETETHFFIDHEPSLCRRLPDSFLADHLKRFPTWHGQRPENVKSKLEAAELILDLFREGRPHVVGAVPNFDTERIAALCRQYAGGPGPGWHYHLIDVENLAVGYLAARGGVLDCSPPWKSDVIAELVGVTITEEERHTALGDARWAMRIYDAVMGGAS